MDLMLRNEVVVVTGSSRGIGRAIAKGFAAEGSQLVLCARGANALQAFAAELREGGTDVTAASMCCSQRRRRRRARILRDQRRAMGRSARLEPARAARAVAPRRARDDRAAERRRLVRELSIWSRMGRTSGVHGREGRGDRPREVDGARARATRRAGLLGGAGFDTLSGRGLGSTPKGGPGEDRGLRGGRAANGSLRTSGRGGRRGGLSCVATGIAGRGRIDRGGRRAVPVVDLALNQARIVSNCLENT